MSTDLDQKQKKTCIQVYSAFAAGLFLHFVPDTFLGTLGLFLLLAVMIMTYVLRGKSIEHDLQHNHMTYIIRTFWLGSLYLGVGVIAATFLIYPEIDVTPIHIAIENLMNGSSTSIETNAILIDLFNENRSLFLLKGLPLVAPGVLFFIYRCVYGTSRAVKGYRVAKPKSWI